MVNYEVRVRTNSSYPEIYILFTVVLSLPGTYVPVGWRGEEANLREAFFTTASLISALD